MKNKKWTPTNNDSKEKSKIDVGPVKTPLYRCPHFIKMEITLKITLPITSLLLNSNQTQNRENQKAF